MRFTRTSAAAVALTMLMTPVAGASTPTGTPSHPASTTSPAPQPSPVKHQPLPEHRPTSHTPPPHPTVPSPSRHASPFVHRADPPASTTPHATPDPVLSPDLDPARIRARHQRAEQALVTAQAQIAAGQQESAIEQLDLAVELDASWSAPLRLRAETFGQLATRYHPSETFLAAQAADLQRLLALEPNVDVAARAEKLRDIQASRQDARTKETRRRRMTTPAILAGTFGASLLLVGAVLIGSTIPPADSEVPGRYRYVNTGIAFVAIGTALTPVAITLGVLAARQSRRDDAARELSAHTGRPPPTLSLAPTGLRLQF